MTLPDRAQLLRLYRLWRAAALLCGLGAVEIGVLAWQRRMPALVLVCLPLVALAIYGARRASLLRRTL